MFGFFFWNSSTNWTSCSQPTPGKRDSRTVTCCAPVAGLAAAGAWVGATAGLGASVGLSASAGLVGAAAAAAAVGFSAGLSAGLGASVGLAAAGAGVGGAAWPQATRIGAARAAPAPKMSICRRVSLRDMSSPLLLETGQIDALHEVALK